MTDAIRFGSLSKVKKMVLFHHDPSNSDDQLEAMFQDSIEKEHIDFELILGMENQVFNLAWRWYPAIKPHFEENPSPPWF